MCFLFYVSFICLHVYAFAIYFMVHCGSAFEPGASGFLITALPSECVPAVICALAVWLASAPITAGSLVLVNLNPINDTYTMPKSSP